MNTINEQLSYMSDEDRYKTYQTIISGCSHLWSKNKLQETKVREVLDTLISLAENDPYFLAHFTSYVFKHTDSKDLKVLSIFANSLSDADGTPFSAGSKYKKPNLRVVSQSLIQDLDPKLVKRVLEIAKMKQPLGAKFQEGTHVSRRLKNSIKKYIRFRESNPKALESIKKSGFAETFKYLYRATRIGPSMEAAEILGWNQKKGGKVTKRKLIDFSNLSAIEIATKIRNESIPVLGALGALPNKISPVVAVALLEQATGNQAVILRELFDGQGLLKHEEVMTLFKSKIKTATTALDRVEKINTEIDEAVSKELKAAKADKRKEVTGDIGKVFIHIDISGSMHSAIEVAKNSCSIIAECVSNPEANFHWGLFNTSGYLLDNPPTFEKDAFAAALYRVRPGGGTNCLACYPKSREFNCDIDIFITDQQHVEGDLVRMLNKYDEHGYVRPKAVVIINVEKKATRLVDAFREVGIPVTEVEPKALTESALVAQTVRQAMLGPISIIESIMQTPLPKLPYWWESV